MNIFLYNLILFGAISFILSLFFTPLVIKLANYNGWIVKPRPDRWNKTPTALMGGLAIFFSFLITLLISSFFYQYNWWIILTFGIMFIIGIIDDLLEVKPIIKLLSQVLCAFILINNGYQFGAGELEWLGIILTFLWVIGITNSINLLDNMDGLAAGITAIITLFAAILSYISSDYSTAILSLILFGSTLGFIKYNFNPAKIFMGDAGSLFLGYSLSYLSLSIQKNTHSSSLLLTLLLPLTLMAIPIFDTTLVTIKRIISGRRIDQGGKDHTSHRLVALGFSEKKAVFILYAITIIWSIVTLLFYKINNLSLTIPLVSLLIIFLSFFGLFLAYVRVYSEHEESTAYHRSRGEKLSYENPVFRFLLMNKKIFVGFIFDILAIYSSFIITSLILRIDFSPSNYIILSISILLKLIIYFITNLYKRSWRYSSILDFSIYFSSNIIASLLLYSIIYILYGKTVFLPIFYIIDFILSFILISFIRVVFKLIQETLTLLKNTNNKIVIYGAGDLGYLLTKQLILNDQSDMKPVAFIDDDKDKLGTKINSIPVCGSIENAKNICIKYDARTLLIASDKINNVQFQKIKNELQVFGIKVGRFSIKIDYDNLNL
jgi:UDP-GlcNAc:undecaprenyl-phosphate GlcNAc-1-phosphate transferase